MKTDKTLQRISGELEEVQAERDRLAAQLRHCETQFKSLFNNATFGIYRTTPEGRILMANPALTRMLGYSDTAELSAKKLTRSDFIPSYSRDDFIDIMQRKGEIKDAEYSWREKDGSIIHVRENACAVRNSAGEIEYFEGFVEDITEKKLAENLIKASEARFRTLVESASDAIYIVDGESRIIAANAETAKILGIPPDNLIGKIIAELFIGEAGSEWNDSVKAVFQQGKTFEKIHFKIKQSGEYRHLTTNFSPIKDDFKEVEYVMCVSRDQSLFLRIEHELRRKEAILQSIGYITEIILRERIDSDALTRVLDLLGRASDMDSVYLYQAENRDDGLFKIELLEKWQTGDESSEDEGLAEEFMNSEKYADWLKILEKGEVVVGKSGDFGTARDEFLRQKGIKSVLIIPIIFMEDLWGFMVYLKRGDISDWRKIEIESLKAAGGTLGAAVGMREAESGLIAAREELEQKVGLRTEELRKINERLRKEIAERVKADKALSKSEANLKAILENTFASFTLYDKNLRIVAFNKIANASTKLMKDKELAVGQSFRYLEEDPEDVEAIREKFQKALQGEVINFEREITHQKFGKRWYEITYAPIYLEGEAAGVTLCNVDITQRKLAEEELRKHKEHLEELVAERTKALSETNVKLRKEIDERRKAEELLRIQRDLGIELSATFDLKEGLEKVLDTLMEVGEVDSGLIHLPDEEKDGIRLAVQRGLSDEFAANVAYFSAKSSQFKLVEQGQPIYKPYSEIRRLENHRSRGADFRAVAIIPLIDRKKLVGVLTLASLRKKNFSRQAKNAFQTIASQAQSAIERLTAQEALKRSEEHYRTLVETSPDAILVTDLTGEILNYNKPALTLFGLPQRGKPAAGTKNLFDFLRVKESVQNQSERIADTEFYKQREYYLHSGDDRTAVVEMRAVLLSEGIRNPNRLTLIIRDITSRKEAEKLAILQRQQIARVEKMMMLGTIVSGMAHEIKNPNNIINLNASLMNKAWESVIPILDQYLEALGDFSVAGIPYSEMRETAPELIEDIVKSSTKIDNIVKELRGIIRHEPESRFFKVNEVVRDSVKYMENRINNATNNFSVHYGDGIPEIYGEPWRLEQILDNLLQNSCQALRSTDDAISIETTYDEQHKWVVIIVKDEGVGIHPENMPFIMESFFTTKKEIGGTGLGLWVCSRFIEDFGGKIIFDSHPGGGTAAKIILPVKQKGDKK